MSKLFCDCKTDEEKSNFFLSGRGVETGVIAPAISNEVAMAFHRCFEFEKQLAAALAAFKVKDAFIEKIAKQTPEKPDYWTPCGQCEHNTSEAEDLLAIQPDDSALKAFMLSKGVSYE